VSVDESSIHDLARITEMGLTAIQLDEVHEHARTCDILINTIPAKVNKKGWIQQLLSHALIFDLSSIPGSTDFEYAERRGNKAIRGRSLPCVVAPKRAGKILADVIKQILMKRGE